VRIEEKDTLKSYLFYFSIQLTVMMSSVLILLVGIVIVRFIGAQYYKTTDKPTQSALIVGSLILSFALPVRFLGHQFDYLREAVPAREVVWAFLASCVIRWFTLRRNDKCDPDLTVLHK